jgi:hypothetical protein
VDGAPDGDWGLVELEGPLPAGWPSLALGSAADGATVVLLGYSGNWGLDPEGTVMPTEMSNHESSRLPLRPLAFVGTLDNAESGRGEILAGVQPGSGASGGAVIDLNGRLVGIVVNTTYFKAMIAPSPEDRTGEGLNFHESIGFKGTPVGVFRAFIEKRWKR